MKRKIKFIIHSLFRIELIRYIIKYMIYSWQALGRLWSYARSRALLKNLSMDSSCHWTAVLKYPDNIHLRGRITIGENCVIGAYAGIIFGNNVRLSRGVNIESASLDINGAAPYKHIGRSITIGDDVWIGAQSIILGGVSIGDRAVIGAGVVVAKDVAPGDIVVGQSFRLIERKEKYKP